MAGNKNSGRRKAPPKLGLKPKAVKHPEKLERGGNPDFPDWLPTDARELYAAICEDMRTTGRLTNLDVPGLRAMCDSYAMIAYARRRLARDEGDKLAMMLWANSQNNFRSWLRQYGMTPYSKDKVELQIEGSSPLADFLNKTG